MRRAAVLPLVLAVAGCGAGNVEHAQTTAPAPPPAREQAPNGRTYRGTISSPTEIDPFTLAVRPHTWFFFAAQPVRGFCGRNRPYGWSFAPVARPRKPVFHDEPLYVSGFCRWYGPIRVNRGGRYVLSVRTFYGATGRYAFTVWHPHVDTFRLRLGAFVGPGHPRRGAGRLETPGSIDRYRFRAPPNTRLVLDAREVDGYCGKGTTLHWAVYSETTKTTVLPDAALYGNLHCYDQGPIELHGGGEYVLSVYGYRHEAAPYSFLLVALGRP